MVLAGLGAGAWLLLASSHSAVTFDPGNVVQAPADNGRTPPSGYKEYKNGAYHISLFYPQELKVKEYRGAAGSMTISFQSTSPVEGFQIFALPYLEPQITPERFKRDEPSGTMDSPQNVTIDGAPATSFYSTDPSLGATAEIWFIHDDFLYEVTTLRPLASWLSGIMQSWEFI